MKEFVNEAHNLWLSDNLFNYPLIKNTAVSFQDWYFNIDLTIIRLSTKCFLASHDFSPTLKHVSSKFEQFKYRLPGKAAWRSSISHMVDCLPFGLQFSSSKLLRMIKRCGTHSLIVLNLRNRIMFVIALEYYRVERRPRRRDLFKLTRAYFQIGGNLRSRRRAGKPSSSAVASYCTMRCATFRGSPRAWDASIASFAERTMLLSGTRRE